VKTFGGGSNHHDVKICIIINGGYLYGISVKKRSSVKILDVKAKKINIVEAEESG